MANSQANFTNINAAADFMGVGAIEVPDFQKEIGDLVRRSSALAQRIQYVPATGSISRFFEQTGIADGAFGDPRAINPASTAPTRIERSLLIKSITNRIDYSLFDLETVAQQGIFPQLKAKDMADMVNGMLRLHAKKLWVGSDTVSGNQVGSGTSFEYVGLLNQISKTATIAAGVSIVDGLRSQVAQMMANPNYEVKPTAIYINPLLLDLLEAEVKNSASALRFIQTDITDGIAGLSVTGLVTAAGVLPLIPDAYIPVDATVPGVNAAPAGQANYFAVILSENEVEHHYIGSKAPRVFQLGTAANLNESYVGVMFGAPVVKQNVAGAHTIVAVQR
jgi:hypothetical protein